MLDDTTTAVLVGVGAAMLGGALAWRQCARHSRRARLIRRLSSPSPVRRAQGGEALVALGLARCARPLLAHVRQEDDPEVRAAIALAVARRQWEPSGTPRVIELREWARTELEGQGYDVVAFGPAFTRLSDMGGPRLPSPQHESWEDRSDGATEPAATGPAATGPAATGPAATGPPPLQWQLDNATSAASTPDAAAAAVPSSQAS